MNTNETQIKSLDIDTGGHDWPFEYPQYFWYCVKCGEIYKEKDKE